MPQGSVEVNVGEVPLAAAYRVDLYPDQRGLDLIEGQSIVGESKVTFDDVEEGRWSVFIQAQNGDNTTIAHTIGKVEVKANETTVFHAGAYLPGLPGTPFPESDTQLPSFGPNGSALLTALFAPGIETLPSANVELVAQSGGGESTVDSPTTLSKSAPAPTFHCATAWLATQAPSDVRQQSSPAPSPTRPVYGSLAPGETTSFYVATSFREVECARVLNDTQTQHCLIFAEVVDGTPVIEDAKALEIARAFDSDNPFLDGDRGIYEETRARYGSEWKTNPVGGRDQDERILLVFLSSGSIGGQAYFGFFRSQDEYPQEQVSNSNLAEVLFINADRANRDVYDALSTISHEFTHLILWNQKQGRDGTFPEGAAAENVTLDEGFAVLNEELSGFGFTGPQGGNFFLLASVDGLLSEGLNRPFFGFRGGLGDYGAGYLLCRYLLDQFGAEKVLKITTSPGVGRDNIAAVTEQPFPTVFANFVQAVALNGETNLPKELAFDDLDLHSSYFDRDGKEFAFSGVQNIGQLELPGNSSSTVTIEPWGAVFIRALGGDGSALRWKAIGVDSLLTRIFDSTGSPTGE